MNFEAECKARGAYVADFTASVFGDQVQIVVVQVVVVLILVLVVRFFIFPVVVALVAVRSVLGFIWCRTVGAILVVLIAIGRLQRARFFALIKNKRGIDRHQTGTHGLLGARWSLLLLLVGGVHRQEC